MLNVFITIDTEILDTSTKIVDKELGTYLEDIQNDIYCVTSRGEFGIRYQIDMLNKYGLKGVFFIDSLMAHIVGTDHICKITKLIQDGGHEVGLHIHTEWLKKTHDPILQGRNGSNIKDFSEYEQQLLITEGIEILRLCNNENVIAFRAGNYGANLSTLRALSKVGIIYDTSYNLCYLNSTCDIVTDNPILQPKKMSGIYEFPISFFEDIPNHYRHAQLCACSYSEMKNALLKAWKQDWNSFVIVLHSCELVKRLAHGKNTNSLTKPNKINVKRFEKLCIFLAHNKDKFHTIRFLDLAQDEIPDYAVSPIKSNLFRTTYRIAEQIIKRLDKV